MNEYTLIDAANSLRLLGEDDANRATDLQQFSSQPDQEDNSDDEDDSPRPLFDTFYEQGGPAAMMQMINFDPQEFEGLWQQVEDEVALGYNVGRGRKSPQKGKDVLFMTLATLKHGGHWEFMGRMFGIKGPTFERMVLRFITMLSPVIQDRFVAKAASEWDMDKLHEAEKTFTSFKCARYATDVTFQQALRPSGNIFEGKRYFSGKHKLYGYKCDFSVLPNGLAVCVSDHYPGSVSDLEIFQRMRPKHEVLSRKADRDSSIQDFDPLRMEHPGKWAIICDKGYEGAQEFMRTIRPKKKPMNGYLSRVEEEYNRTVSSDRIIVENFFGRLGTLWDVCCRKWRWAEEQYDDIFKICVGLSNFHIRLHPLRHDDSAKYNMHRNRLLSIGEDISRKRKQVQERYREKRRRRLELQFRAQGASYRQEFD